MPQQSEPLTKRQLEIVMHLANGYRAAEVGKLLHISTSSVNTTIANARRRVQARTIPHLVSIAIANGYFEWNTEAEMRYLNGSES